jgi:hypothetical protein
MWQSIQDRSKAVVFVFCALIVAMSIVSPICPACDGLGSPHINHSSVFGKALPSINDDCNGVCSCCGFQWLPSIKARLADVAIVTTVSIPQDEHYPSRFVPPLFLPPRS